MRVFFGALLLWVEALRRASKALGLGASGFGLRVSALGGFSGAKVSRLRVWGFRA